MQDDTKQFDAEHLTSEDEDFMEYQHKKLEKVAEIIKEEERAAKLIADSENKEKSPMKTNVVIDSIVKHKAPEASEPHEGLAIEQAEGLTVEAANDFAKDELVEAADNDQETFEAIDRVVQASHNDFNTSPEDTFEADLEMVDLSDVEVDNNDKSEVVSDVETLDLPEIDLSDREEASESVEEAVVERAELVADSLSAQGIAIETFEPDAITSEPESNELDDAESQTDEAGVDFAAVEEAIVLEKEQAQQAVAVQPPKISKIGRILLDLGKITRSDTKKILRAQKKHGLLFGDAALKLGLINNDDIQKVVAMQFNYHYLQAGQGKFSDDLVAAYAPFSKKVENYRALRSQLMMHWFKKGQRALAVVGANSGDGVSYLTANLGVVFSQLGARTLIVEANMRAPRHKDIFNIRNTLGLSDVIVGKVGNDAIEEIESIPDLSVLHAGTVPPNPQELLGRTSFNILMKTLMDSYDVILIDTPPVVQSADAQSVIEIAEGAMLVSRLHHTRQSDVLEVRHHIEMTGASIVTAVMNTF